MRSFSHRHLLPALALSLVMVPVSGTAQAQCSASWAQLIPSASPSARDSVSLASDNSGNVYAFYGTNGAAGCAGVSSEIWKFDGVTWSLVPINDPNGVAPPAQGNPSVAYDSTRGRFMVYARSQACASSSNAAQLYAFNPNPSNPSVPSWTIVNPNGGAPGPNTGNLVYDSRRDVLVMITGAGPTPGPEAGTWEYSDATGWVRRAVAANNPQHPPTTSVATAYDSTRGKVVAFGALTYPLDPVTATTNSADLWEWDGAAGTWTKIIPASFLNPEGRYATALGYDPIRQRLVLSGGVRYFGNGAYQIRGDGWEYNAANQSWTFSAAETPTSRYSTSMAWDALRTRMIIFGGNRLPGVNPPQGDTWALTVETRLSPVITRQPASTQARLQQAAVLSVQTVFGDYTYQWRKDGVNLSDNGRVFGSRTPNLTINNIARTDFGVYDVVVSSRCGSTLSNGASVLPTTCPGDFNFNGNVSVQDVFDFLSAYFAGCP